MTPEEIDDWEAALDNLIAATAHFKTQRGKPGEALARADWKNALDHFEELSRNLD